MPRPLFARVDLAALRHNYHLIENRLKAAQKTPPKIWSVLKADAYGHGLIRVAKTLNDVTGGFALLEMEAALLLRAQGIQKPILLLEGIFDPSQIKLCRQHRLIPVIHQLEQLKMLRAEKSELPIYLKFNTGMNRLGFAPAQAKSILRTLADTSLDVVSLMTHFAAADEKDGIKEPLAIFEEIKKVFQERIKTYSLANSAALFQEAKTHAHSVRPGIALYGGSPFADQSAKSLGLKPVMTLKSRLIAIQTIKAGEKVGYSGTFVAPSDMRIGVVACGYADGYPRNTPTGTPILVEGKKTALIGRVSMDLLTCDVTHLPEAQLGSAVTLWGEGLPAEEVAAFSNTISYELFCALAKRVPVSETSLVSSED